MLEMFALVIMLNGWAVEGQASRGNAMDHIPGFTTKDKCEKAGEIVKATSGNPSIVRTFCVVLGSVAEPETGTTLIVIMHGWDQNAPGTGARGNVIHHISGFVNTRGCEMAGDQIRQGSANQGTTKTACVDL